LPAETYPVEFGDYRLLRKLAQGGMAEIFLAQDKSGKVCALKRILPHLAQEEAFIRMFIDEARIVSLLNHPNIARLKDQGRHDGYYFIAMEFVQGHSLLSLSERARSMKVPLPLGLLAYVVSELLAGLGCAHEAKDQRGRHLRVVHRDVTPQNVLISYDGEVKLIDFGVAKARSRLTVTEAGFTKGKLSYMSPEQARGEELDARSDLFSVGIILFELSTKTRLFNKEGPGGVLGAIVNDPIPRPSGRSKSYPSELEDIVMRALEKDVARRWQSAEEMRFALLQFSRVERPTPGRSRLKNLVHDLFGTPENQELIDALAAETAPTPEKVKVPSVVLAAGAGASESLLEPVSERVVLRREQTRMMSSNRVPAGEGNLPVATSASVALGEVAGSEAYLPIPALEVPPRVRVGRFIADFRPWLRGVLAERRVQIFQGIGVLLLIMLAGLTHELGGFSSLWDFMKDAVATLTAPRDNREASPSDRGLAMGPTQLLVRSEPPGASIEIGGLATGHLTPYLFESPILGQPFEIRLVLPGYRLRKEELNLWSEQGKQEILLALEREAGILKIRTEPAGASIRIDGRSIEQQTPLTLADLPVGVPIRIEAQKTGYHSGGSVAEVADNETKEVVIQLEIDKMQVKPGEVSVRSEPSGCIVWLDDQPIGETPVNQRNVKAGLHSVRVACDHHADERSMVEVFPEETARVSVRLRPNAFGTLTVQVIPREGSFIEIDGKGYENPAEYVQLVPGPHEIRASNPELNLEKQVRVEVLPNEQTTRRINLVQ
jgi:eukaryotic-like serine/threonine-protein kinase